MNLNELTFRNIYHNYFYLPYDESFVELLKPMPNHEIADGVLLYGYIDHETGLSYEVLACATLTVDDLILYQGNDKVALKLRAQNVNLNELKAIDPNYSQLKQYASKVSIIDKFYRCSDAVAKTRQIGDLDTCRSFDFPDDVLVVLDKAFYQPEGCWVRLEGANEKTLYGTLLHEPQSDLGVHTNDMIEFKIYNINDRIMCYCKMK